MALVNGAWLLNCSILIIADAPACKRARAPWLSSGQQYFIMLQRDGDKKKKTTTATVLLSLVKRRCERSAARELVVNTKNAATCVTLHVAR